MSRLPHGYQTVVGERGSALSAGERQRIACARAFLVEPRVLILDEPTASLDPETEHDLIAGLEAVMEGRTTIVITHRLEVARRADRVLVLEDASAPEQRRVREPVRRARGRAGRSCAGMTAPAAACASR